MTCSQILRSLLAYPHGHAQDPLTNSTGMLKIRLLNAEHSN